MKNDGNLREYSSSRSLFYVNVAKPQQPGVLLMQLDDAIKFLRDFKVTKLQMKIAF